MKRAISYLVVFALGGMILGPALAEAGTNELERVTRAIERVAKASERIATVLERAEQSE